MIYGDLRLRDRLLRGFFGGVMGGGAGFLLGLGRSIWNPDWHRTGLLVTTLVGTSIGAVLAFRRNRIGW